MEKNSDINDIDTNDEHIRNQPVTATPPTTELLEAQFPPLPPPPLTTTTTVTTDPDTQPNIETFIKHDIGCGPFNVVFTLVCYLMKGTAAWGLLFMAFGNYNPGWTCVQHSRLNSSDIDGLLKGHEQSSRVDILSPYYNVTRLKGSCAVLPTCDEVEFEPGVSTLVTEWSLLCDRVWIQKTILAIQMVGLFCGAYLSGAVGDRFGRKISCYIWVLLCLLANAASAFSPSWEVFAVVRVFAGLSLGGIMASNPVLLLEYMTTPKWRIVVMAIPAFDFATVIFGLVLMLLKNWRHIQIAMSVLTFLSLLTAIWVPESLRWLTLQGKTEEAHKTVRKICKFNNKPTPRNLDFAYEEGKQKDKKATIVDLFNRRLVMRTVSTSFIYFSLSLTYYSLAFGLKALTGDFYVNFIVFSLVTLPGCIFPPILGTKFGRRLGSIISYVILTALAFAVIPVFFFCPDPVRGITIRIMVFGINFCLEPLWGLQVVFINELFPTSVRANAIALANMCARIGGVVAVYLVPRSFDTIYVCCASVGALGVVCCVLLAFLPETKNSAMGYTATSPKTGKRRGSYLL